MKVGTHEFPKMTDANIAFGAERNAYPNTNDIPLEHRKGYSDGCKAFSALFFSGGRLSDHNLALKPDVNAGEFYRTLKSLMASFAPSHELKAATCGWFIQEHTKKLHKAETGQ